MYDKENYRCVLIDWREHDMLKYIGKKVFWAIISIMIIALFLVLATQLMDDPARVLMGM